METSFDTFYDEDRKGAINLIKTQLKLLQGYLCFGQKGSEKKSNDDHESDDQDDEVEVGDGQFMSKSLLTFKILVFDTAT